jgi:hypothetical protein
MSVQRGFAQRKNNVVDLVPVYNDNSLWNSTYLLNIDPRNCSQFNVDLTGLQTETSNQGSLHGAHDDNNALLERLSVHGIISTPSGIPLIFFAIIVDPSFAALYPGLEFTVNFIRGDQDNDICVDVFPNAALDSESTTDNYTDSVMTPLRGFAENNVQSLTLRSNGKQFVVVSSGPVSWSTPRWC